MLKEICIRWNTSMKMISKQTSLFYEKVEIRQINENSKKYVKKIVNAYLYFGEVHRMANRRRY